MKKTICLATNWYPTKENPFVGHFFKEQAFVVEDEFDFIIFRYQEKLRKKPWQKDEVYICNEERNTVEYTAVAYIPITTYIENFLHNVVVKLKKETVDGIGRYISSSRKKFTKKKICELFSKTGQSVDVFYCVDAQNEAYNLQCLAKAYNKSYVVGEHAPVPWPGSLISDVNKYAIEGANRFLAISHDKIRQILLQNIKLPPIFYIGNLIDETNLLYSPRKESDVKTFVIVAAHSFYKNYDMFINVMNRLTELTEKDFRVMVVGYGANKGYSKNIEELENKIYQSKFASKAELIPSVPHEKIGGIFNRADAFVMTSIQEGQPVSAMEAACCGLPIFSTRCGGVEDYVDNSMGRIYSVSDVDGMANGLKEFIEDTIRFEPLHIRNKVIDIFGRDAFRKKFLQVFREVMNNA